MKTHRLFMVLTVVNFGLALFLLFRPGLVEAQDALSVLRGSGLEIIDDQGRLRASVNIQPAGTTANGEAFPETVLLRLIDGNGQPSVKVSTSGTMSGLSFVGGDDESYVVLQANGPNSSLKMVEPDGRQRLFAP
jgi:hypothetical protein